MPAIMRGAKVHGRVSRTAFHKGVTSMSELYLLSVTDASEEDINKICEVLEEAGERVGLEGEIMIVNERVRSIDENDLREALMKDFD